MVWFDHLRATSFAGNMRVENPRGGQEGGTGEREPGGILPQFGCPAVIGPTGQTVVRAGVDARAAKGLHTPARAASPLS